MKKYFAVVVFGFILAMLMNLRPAVANQSVLSNIKNCLPNNSQRLNIKYQLSLADRADIVSTQVNQPFRYLLVRANDPHLEAPLYTIVALKRNKRCVNYTQNYRTDSQLFKFIPPRVSARFKAVIDSDLSQLWSKFVKDTQRRYPGKSVEQLQKMGLLGLD